MVSRGDHPIVFHNEKIAAHALSYIAVDIEQNGPGIRILRSHLELALHQIDIVVDFGSRAHRLRWRAPNGGNHHRQSIAVIFRSGCKRQRLALNQNGGFELARTRSIVNPFASRHPLRHPIVAMVWEQRQVGLQHLHGELRHLVFRQPWVDAHIFERAVKAVEVVVQLKDLPTKSTRGIEHSIAPEEAIVVNRNLCLAGWNDLTVQIDDAFLYH